MDELLLTVALNENKYIKSSIEGHTNFKPDICDETPDIFQETEYIRNKLHKRLIRQDNTESIDTELKYLGEDIEELKIAFPKSMFEVHDYNQGNDQDKKKQKKGKSKVLSKLQANVRKITKARFNIDNTKSHSNTPRNLPIASHLNANIKNAVKDINTHQENFDASNPGFEFSKLDNVDIQLNKNALQDFADDQKVDGHGAPPSDIQTKHLIQNNQNLGINNINWKAQNDQAKRDSRKPQTDRQRAASSNISSRFTYNPTSNCQKGNLPATILSKHVRDVKYMKLHNNEHALDCTPVSGQINRNNFTTCMERHPNKNTNFNANTRYNREPVENEATCPKIEQKPQARKFVVKDRVNLMRINDSVHSTDLNILTNRESSVDSNNLGDQQFRTSIHGKF